jgi:hypothetical protein
MGKKNILFINNQTFSSSYERQRCKASAWYYVAYQAGTILSFGWIMNRLMCDIIRQKKMPQEDHQAWRSIGTAIHNGGFQSIIRNLATSFNLSSEEYRSLPETEKLGCQFLRVIERLNEVAQCQKLADEYLAFLHRVALHSF